MKIAQIIRNPKIAPLQGLEGSKINPKASYSKRNHTERQAITSSKKKQPYPNKISTKGEDKRTEKNKAKPSTQNPNNLKNPTNPNPERWEGNYSSSAIFSFSQLLPAISLLL